MLEKSSTTLVYFLSSFPRICSFAISNSSSEIIFLSLNLRSFSSFSSFSSSVSSGTVSTFSSNLSTDSSVLTESALYYVEKKGKDTQSEVTVNALFKWSGSAGKFIQINDTASLVNSLFTLEGKVTTLEGTVAGHVTEINSINQNIGTINQNIENITKESGIIDTKVAASAEALTGLINGKVSQDEFNTLNTTVTNHIAAQTTKDNAQDELIQKNIDDIGKNAEDIQDIRDTIESLTGTEGGSIGEQIDAKIQASEAK